MCLPDDLICVSSCGAKLPNYVDDIENFEDFEDDAYHSANRLGTYEYGHGEGETYEVEYEIEGMFFHTRDKDSEGRKTQKIYGMKTSYVVCSQHVPDFWFLMIFMDSSAASSGRDSPIPTIPIKPTNSPCTTGASSASISISEPTNVSCTPRRPDPECGRERDRSPRARKGGSQDLQDHWMRCSHAHNTHRWCRWGRRCHVFLQTVWNYPLSKNQSVTAPCNCEHSFLPNIVVLSSECDCDYVCWHEMQLYLCLLTWHVTVITSVDMICDCDYVCWPEMQLWLRLWIWDVTGECELTQVFDYDCKYLHKLWLWLWLYSDATVTVVNSCEMQLWLWSIHVRCNCKCDQLVWDATVTVDQSQWIQLWVQTCRFKFF